MTALGPRLDLGEEAARADLATYVTRARRLDPDGAARLVARDGVLAAYVSPVHGGSGPTVIGLRTSAVPDPTAVDVTVTLSALADRLAAPAASGALLSLPPVGASAAWAGITPPRSGWELVTGLDPTLLLAASREGIDEVAAAVPAAAAEHVVSQVRGVVWGRPLAGHPGLPAGAAYAADALGFLDPQEAVAVRRAGPWWRLSTARGHVLARAALL